MGKIGGTLASAVGLDRGIKSGTQQGIAGYNQAIQSYNTGKEQGLGFLQPYTNIGQGALNPLSTLITGSGYDAETGQLTQVSPEERYAAFEASPGYQFRFNEGLRGVQNALSAQGKSSMSGRGLEELTQFGQGLATDEYSNYINNLQQLAGIGQASAGQSANIASNVAGQIGQAQIGIGNLGMQSNIARAQNKADLYGSIGAQIDQAAMTAGAGGMSPGAAALFSDIRLKEKIQKIGKSNNGISIYRFNYKNKNLGAFRYEGVMAQDLLRLKPEALSERNGYLMVDYSKIDVNFRRI